jgi:hypothetical protein
MLGGRSALLRQADFVQKYVLYGGGEFVVVDDALDGATGAGAKTSHVSDVAFGPRVFASAGRDDSVIGGIDESTNETVIERLELVSNVGIPGVPPTKTFRRTQIFRGALTDLAGQLDVRHVHGRDHGLGGRQ